VTPRVSPAERIRAEMAELIADTTTGSLADVFEDVARLAVRLALQSALEAEVTEFLGRDRYARGDRAREGSRNGYCPTTIKTTAGEVTLQRPKVRGTAEAFASRLLGVGVTRTNALESLVIAGFVRGLSVRDVEASLADALGPDATVSKSTVSRICVNRGRFTVTFGVGAPQDPHARRERELGVSKCVPAAVPQQEGLQIVAQPRWPHRWIYTASVDGNRE
jgi:putative transposase